MPPIPSTAKIQLQLGRRSFDPTLFLQFNCSPKKSDSFLDSLIVLREFANRLLKIARTSLAYFKIGPLLSFCKYLSDWSGFFISLIFSLSKVKSRVWFFTSHIVILFVREEFESKVSFYTDSNGLSRTV